MWPILFSAGFLTVPTSAVILFFGFLLSGFVFWKRGKEEHYSELQLFDGFLLSFVVGALFARFAFVLLHFSQFGWNIVSWFDFAGRPGTQDLIFLVAATLFLYRFALKKKWDAFEILDFWSLSLTLWLFFTALADFAAGVGQGRFTNWFMGVVFPGSIERTHPVQLYLAILYLGLYLYLNWAESRYRIFEWYRMGKKSAQSGFLISTFCVFFSLFAAFMLLFRLPEFFLFNISLDLWLYILGMIIGVQILLRRSDKPLLPASFKERFSRQSETETLLPPQETDAKHDSHSL